MVGNFKIYTVLETTNKQKSLPKKTMANSQDSYIMTEK